MSVQRRNSEMVSLLTSDLQARNEPNFAIANAVSTFLMLPELRGFWPFSSINENGAALDLSGQARTLTNNGAAPRATAGLVPYVSFNGTTQWYSRADEAGLDITGALTIGQWIYFNNAAGASIEWGINKTGASGNFGYGVRRLATSGLPDFYISSTGSNFPSAVGTDALAAGTWYFLAGRFSPSTEIALFVNQDKFVNTTGIPAAIFNSSAALAFGGSNRAAGLAGRGTLGFVCAAALPDAMIYNLFEQTRSAFGVAGI